MILINADKLRQEMYHNAFETDTELQKWDGGCWIRYKLFENILDAQPIVDAPERKKGKWIQRSDIPNAYTCSNCYQVIYAKNRKYLAEYHAFCGKCGLDMRGETDDAT